MERKLACPYFKRYPEKYVDVRVCCGPGWDSVHRVKEHLYRKHSWPKFRCFRCYTAFDDSESLAVHARSDERCTNQTPDSDNRFDEKTEMALKSRTRGIEKKSMNERWVEVYRILFPTENDDAVPSPYYEYVEKSTMSVHGHDQTLQEYNEFIRRELSPVLREELSSDIEAQLNVFEDGLKDRVTKILQRLNQRLFSDFKSSRRAEDASVQISADASATAQSARPLNPSPSCEVPQDLASAPQDILPVGFLTGYELAWDSFPPEYLEIPVQFSLGDQEKEGYLDSDDRDNSSGSNAIGNMDCPSIGQELYLDRRSVNEEKGTEERIERSRDWCQIDSCRVV
ncbi:hypothetical protein BJ170DRAFT_460906 [Xylariales sp. AK1849]|nr:hypothetical protein BJ170DRAFT_460906 [Xylariales sp. AK1849]